MKLLRGNDEDAVRRRSYAITLFKGVVLRWHGENDTDERGEGE